MSQKGYSGGGCAGARAVETVTASLTALGRDSGEPVGAPDDHIIAGRLGEIAADAGLVAVDG